MKTIAGVLAVVLFAGTYARLVAAAERSDSQTAPPAVQTRDGVALKLLGAKHHTERETLLIRLEYRGRDLGSVNFGAPVIRVDGVKKSHSAPG